MRARSPCLASAAPLIAVAVGVFGDGGYAHGQRIAFAGAAALAAAVTVHSVPREPVVLVLLALALIGGLSALWTVGPVSDTVIWALVTAGYGLVAMSATAVAARPGGVVALAAGLAVIAAAAAALGLVSAALGQYAFAERPADVWRAGGPFGYPPALALLEVSALPALLAGMTARSRPVAAASAIAMAMAGGVLAESASRTSLALALAVAGAAVAWPSRALGRPTPALALGAAAGLVLVAAQGAGEALRLAALAVVLVAAAPVWLAARARVPVATVRRPGRPALAVAAIAAVAVLGGAVLFGASANRGTGPAGGFLHGRPALWRAALETFADHPVQGAGADAFLTASARHQGGATIAFAHDLPLELAVELGLAGIVAALALYLATGRLVWRARHSLAGRLLGPAAAAFLVSSLTDWPWHLAGAGAAWALATGALTTTKEP